MLRLQRIILPGLVLFAMIGLLGLPVVADDIVLSNNSGESSTLWFITGEASLIINGFDLAPLGVELPAVINSISLSVSQPAPGVTVDAVVYQDSNGGSPVDAVLAAQTRVEIAESGAFTATFNPPVIISAPVVWLGFYLPVDFEFRADESGSSVLTYWPGQRAAHLTSAIYPRQPCSDPPMAVRRSVWIWVESLVSPV